ncbi:MAG: hypothetical protein ACR2OU_02840, partial [Thermomicrobiales bacterium]
QIAQTPPVQVHFPVPVTVDADVEDGATDIPHRPATLAEAIELTRALAGMDIASIDLNLPRIKVQVRLRRR